jgi:hypothetical protein
LTALPGAQQPLAGRRRDGGVPAAVAFGGLAAGPPDPPGVAFASLASVAAAAFLAGLALMAPTVIGVTAGLCLQVQPIPDSGHFHLDLIRAMLVGDRVIF